MIPEHHEGDMLWRPLRHTRSKEDRIVIGDGGISPSATCICEHEMGPLEMIERHFVDEHPSYVCVSSF